MRQQNLQESIVHISVGFEGPHIVQVFSVRKLPPPASGLQMCIYDGKVYIGAKYNSSDYPEVQDYWFLEITAKFTSQTTPLIIKSMQVVNTFPRKLVGSPPCTLADYFSRQTSRTSESGLGEPVKKIKYSNDYCSSSLKGSEAKKQQQKDKIPLSPNLYKKKQEFKPKIQPEKKVNEKKLKIDDSDEQREKGERVHKSSNARNLLSNATQASLNCDKKNEKNIVIQQEQEGDNYTRIIDLHERRIGWTIMCRINYLNKVECRDGLFAKNFMLTDERGDEIKCVYFENPLDDEQDLQTGKYYTFSGGQITKVASNSEGPNGPKILQINFDKNAHIIQRENVQFTLNLDKFCRIETIPSISQRTEINVIGIIKVIKVFQQNSKSKLKYSATICDPISRHEIDLLIFLNGHEIPPEKGSIGFLHNYTLFKQSNTCRLNSTYKSYFRQETEFKDKLSCQFKKAKEQLNWQSLHYKNLSMVPFSFRTIKDLKNIVHRIDDDKIYSLVDCWVFDIQKKKFYHACRNCKKGTDKKDSGVFYCQNCRRNVDTFHCHTLTVNFADFTSHMPVDVIGEHAQTLLEIRSSQFHELSSQRQLIHLDSLRFKNVTLKLKTERKDMNKRQSHSVWAIDESCVFNTLKEISRKIAFYDIKIDEKW